MSSATDLYCTLGTR